jgi:hypothetical protein
MARGLYREPEFHVLGFVPVERNVGVASAALQLGVALHHLSARPVTLVDCNTAAPAWSAIAGGQGSRKEIDEQVCPGLSIAGQRNPTPSIDFEWCESAITSRVQGGHYVLCDLSGLAETGGIGRFYSHLNGLVSVVRPGGSFEWRLTALHRQFPKHLDRGVLFLEP